MTKMQLWVPAVNFFASCCVHKEEDSDIWSDQTIELVTLSKSVSCPLFVFIYSALKL